MNRNDLHLLAEARLSDAESLLHSKRWSAAYYLLGYTVECALKACASRQFGLHVIPEKKVVEEFYSHDLGTKLLSISGVKMALEARAKAEIGFDSNWKTVCGWNEKVRYDHSITETKARDMHIAVTDATSGVLPWLKTLW